MLLDGKTDPQALFSALFARAQAEEPFDATAVALATATEDGRPAVRMVLLKGADERGFVFYTNYESRKGRELLGNPHAALCFYWPKLGIQVRVEGAVEKTSDAESDAYFASRARGSQIGAWASEQSRPLAGRDELLERVESAEARLGEGTVPRPPHWGGFLLAPAVIEFWVAQPSRLHDRVQYRRSSPQAPWSATRLFP
ncbi:MAG: pyridoxamine 5'-phosphate oxidase [Polyangia bacterium]